MRAPYLLNGGNTMFTMLQEDNFTYDATQPTNEFGYMNMANGRWPHTLDYLREQDCQVGWLGHTLLNIRRQICLKLAPIHRLN